MTVTGERVSTGEGGFNPTWQRHVAAYGSCAPLLPRRGGCSTWAAAIGHSSTCWRRARPSASTSTPARSPGQDRETVVADMRELPFADGELRVGRSPSSRSSTCRTRSACSAEVARVLEPGGMAVFVTPNRLTFARPDEIIDPYHYVEYDPHELRPLCGPYFAEVELRGLFGSPRYLELVERGAAQARRAPRKGPAAAAEADPEAPAAAALRPPPPRRARGARTPPPRRSRSTTSSCARAGLTRRSTL